MKKSIMLLLSMTFIMSCAITTDYYQVYKTKTETGILESGKIEFEDVNCIIKYDLWENGGNIGFSIFNKTENDIILDLSKTFFVINDVSHGYFQNRVFSNGFSSGTSVSATKSGTSAVTIKNWYFRNTNIASAEQTSTSSISTSYVEMAQLIIPSRTLINVNEFNITNERFIHCDLAKFPSSKITTLKYSEENTPFIFYNLITYITKADTIRFKNRFYVSEIGNYPSDEMIINVDTSKCGTLLDYPEKHFKKSPPDEFYVKYSRE